MKFIKVFIKRILVTTAIMLITIIPAAAGDWQNPFTDVKDDAWFYSSVAYACDKQLFAGTSPTTFSPTKPITRAMFVKVIANLEGINLATYTSTNYEDVDISMWYGPAIAWAEQSLVVSGYSKTEFKPNTNVTREQMCVIMYNYIIYSDTQINSFQTKKTYTDDQTIGYWAIDAVYYCQQIGLIKGKTGDRFDPKGLATRAEAATVFTLFCQNY